MAVRTRTLTANTVLKLTVSPGEWNHVGVFNRSTTDTVYATINGADPVADGNDVFCVPPGSRRELHYGNTTGNDVRLISGGTPKVEVEWA